MINGAVKFCVPLVSQLNDVAAEVGTRVANLAKERVVARQQTAIEETYRQFGICGIDLVAIRRSVDGLADAQPQIPKIAQKHGERLFDGGLHLLIRRQDQKVNIGVRKKFVASISAHGEERDFGRHPLPALLNKLVDARSPGGDGCRSVARAEELVADFAFGHNIHFSVRNLSTNPNTQREQPMRTLNKTRQMLLDRHITASFCLAFYCAGVPTPLCRAADLQEIVGRATATLQSDWAADPDYAYVERNEVQKNDKVTSKTSQVVYIAGSDYYLPLAINDQTLTPDREKAELEKLKDEVRRRNMESQAARRQRIEKYKKQRDENEALVLDFPNAFTFEMVREETMNGYPAYVLSGTPKRRTGAVSLAAKVLSGMRGTVWVDKENFHAIRVECDVTTPVPIYGILARVLPGTHIEFGMEPVTNSTWLIGELTMKLKVSKLGFKSMEVTSSTYSGYRLNDRLVAELLSK
jgi:hypothetical protein